MTAVPAGRRPELLRPAVWLLHMLLPLLGLWLLLARPFLDVRWEHHSSHFWLVVAVAVVNVVLGLQMSEAAGRRDDLRLFLVALAFLSSAGFLLLHAVATPACWSAAATPASWSPPRSACCSPPASRPSPRSA